MFVGIYICSSQEFHRVDRYPFYIGQGTDVDLQLIGPSISDRQCTIHQGQSKPVVQSHVADGIKLNGQPVNVLELTEEIQPIIIGNWCAYIVYSNQLDQWQEKLTQGNWYYHQVNQPKSQSYPYRQILSQFDHTHDPNSCFLSDQHTDKAFSLADLRKSNDEYNAYNANRSDLDSNDSKEHEVKPEINEDIIKKEGEYRCPYCWESFEAKDFMYIATDAELKRDPHLGDGHYLRFKPTKYSGGKALDPNGSVASEIACPHCHLSLPRNIKNTSQKIISVVGDAASGKSYYLSVISKILNASLPTHFNVLFTDATPGGNDVLHRMVNSLWGANSPEDVSIVKTQLFQDTYQQLRIIGQSREISMPKAFIFTATNLEDDKKRTNLVFYDNAGEHFRPQSNSADTPGAQHVANADGIIFLLDPFNQNDFKQKLIQSTALGENADPQLNNQVDSNPDVILDEMQKRIEELTGQKKLKIPFAFVVGKCDAWQDSMIPKGKKLYEPRIKIGNEHNYQPGLDLGIIKHNSEIIEGVLSNISPGLVARAKSLSENYMFFGASNFGHPAVPIKREDPETGESKIVPLPDPKRLSPILADSPVLWILSRSEPGIINTVNNEFQL